MAYDEPHQDGIHDLRMQDTARYRIIDSEERVEDRSDGVEDGARFAIAKDVVLMFLR